MLLLTAPTALCVIAFLQHAVQGTASTVVLNTNDVQTTSFDGWGTSLAWWANAFGNTSDSNQLAELCFTTNTVNFRAVNVPGLGFNIVRYNMGASDPAYRITDTLTSKTIPQHKSIAAFQLPSATGTNTTSWNWSVDTAQRNMLLHAVKRGANQIEFFSNSPPWWMCRNESATGWIDGGENLKLKYENAFTEYLATVAAHAENNWGVKVNYLSPFNEPSAWWWKSPGKQEGCHFKTNTQRQVIRSLSASLQKHKLCSTALSASDENDMDTALKTWNELGSDYQALVSKLNVHGYSGLAPYRGKGRIQLRQAVGNRSIWMSEFCDKDPTGQTLARSIILDINELKANGWCYWQAIDGGTWGLLRANYQENQVESVNRKFFVMSHFSRHITPGAQILKSPHKDLVSAWRPGDRKLVLVHLNEESTQPLRLHITGRRLSHKADVRSTQLLDKYPLEACYIKSTMLVNQDDILLPASPGEIVTLEVGTD